MTRTLISKVILVALLIAVLTASSTSAASPTRGRGRVSKPAISSATGFWEGVMQFLRKEGCGLDPNGILCPAPMTTPTSNSDAGCTIDPNGRCLTGG